MPLSDPAPLPPLPLWVLGLVVGLSLSAAAAAGCASAEPPLLNPVPMLEDRAALAPEWFTDRVGYAAVDALQRGERAAWKALLAPDARFVDDRVDAPMAEFDTHIFGKVWYVTFDRVDDGGLDLDGQLHNSRDGSRFWGRMRLGVDAEGRVAVIDIGRQP